MTDKKDAVVNSDYTANTDASFPVEMIVCLNGEEL